MAAQHQQVSTAPNILLIDFKPHLSFASNLCRLESQLAEAQKAVEVVNRERKLSQTEVQRELSGYQAQYRATLEKNAEIEAACAEVERELQAVVAELPK